MTEWHPILAATEPSPGCWELLDDYGRLYCTVRLVRRGAEVGYRVETHGQLVGYFRTLRASCHAGHMVFIASMGPQGPANAGRPSWEKPLSLDPSSSRQ